MQLDTWGQEGAAALTVGRALAVMRPQYPQNILSITFKKILGTHYESSQS